MIITVCGNVQAIGTADEHDLNFPGFPGFFLDGRSPFFYDARAQEESQPAKLRPLPPSACVAISIHNRTVVGFVLNS
jgi:hypothetical protein